MLIVLKDKRFIFKIKWTHGQTQHTADNSQRKKEINNKDQKKDTILRRSGRSDE